jgi:hypothetical protein
MSATPAVEPRNDVERLLRDLAHSESVEFAVVSGDGLFITWLRGSERETPECSCHRDSWSVVTRAWALHFRSGVVRSVRFVREPDVHSPQHESLSVQFVGSDGRSLLRAHFRPLYDDQDRPLAAPFASWEALRAKYGGQDEIAAEQGTLQPGQRAS